MSRGTRRLVAARSGLSKIAGYSLSMLVLAVASLAIIPVIVGADGPRAWASIAVGQSIGGVAAVLVGYGWGLTGPAVVARADPPARVRAHSESLWVKCVLLVPAGATAASLAALLTPTRPDLAAVGALSTATVGLTASWYFVGLSRPYALFFLETFPRVLGTVVGIALMLAGADAFVGVMCVLGGMVLAFVASSIFIQSASGVPRGERLPRSPLWSVLGSQGLGLSSTLLSSGYVAAPVLIVSAVAPYALPVYAIVDKVQRQVSVALNPFVTVFQGWVPRATSDRLRERVFRALALSVLFSTLLGVGMLIVAPYLIAWLGGDQIRPGTTTLVLMAGFVALALFEAVVSKAILIAIDRVDVVATATLVGSLVGLPLVAVGAVFFGPSGALGGILVGLALRVGIELTGVFTTFRRADRPVSTAVNMRRTQRAQI